jgi:tripartite-type tricarboxylate transporter receptor subunit TctC
MLGGRVHVYWPTPSTGLPLIRDGKIKVLAVTSAKRHADLPQVPTMRELGKDELSLEFWAGLWAPAGTPDAIIEKLNAVTNEALKPPEMAASLQKLGFETRVGSPQDFARFIAAEIPRWLTVVRKSDVKSP